MTKPIDLEPAGLEAARDAVAGLELNRASDYEIAEAAIRAYLASRSAPEAGKAVDAAMAETMAEKIAEHLEIDWDGDEPFVRSDSIEAGVCAALASPAPSGAETCERCQGNGEIVTDWDRYLGPVQPGDAGDEGTAECPDCDGTGRVEPVAPQAVAPAEEIAVAGLIERLTKPSRVRHRHTGQLTDKSPPAVQIEAARALTSLSADKAKLVEWAALIDDRATASEAEASGLRRKLEERERIGKMMANAIYNVHQRGLHVNTDDMDSLKECQEAWDRALTTDGGANG